MTREVKWAACAAVKLDEQALREVDCDARPALLVETPVRWVKRGVNELSPRWESC